MIQKQQWDLYDHADGKTCPEKIEEIVREEMDAAGAQEL